MTIPIFPGLSQESLNAVLHCVNTLEILLDKNDCELRSMLNHNVNIREEEIRRFLRAIFNLKRCREAITIGKHEPNELFWDSWDRHTSASASPRSYRSTSRYQQHLKSNRLLNTVSGIENSIQTIDITIKDGNQTHDTVDRQNYLISPEDTSVSTLTSSPSPPNSPSTMQNTKNNKRGFNSTPPARKKHQTILPLNQQQQQQQAQTSNSYQQYSYQQQFTPPLSTSNAQSNSINFAEATTKYKTQESQSVI